MPRIFLLSVMMMGLLVMPLHANNWPDPIVDDPEIDERRELLLSHGVDLETTVLLDLLRHGFRDSALPGGMPERPMMKSTVINAAIEELGVTARGPAVPLLIDIVEREFPDGVEKIVLRDFETLPVSQINSHVDQMYELLVINAIVALGLIGDERAEEAILNRMSQEEKPAFVLRGSLALGQMGSNRGFPHLYRIARDEEHENADEAFRLFYILTGRNYGVTDNTSRARHRQIIEQLSEWYNSEGHDMEVHRSEVLRRMRRPPRNVMIDTSSLRGLLRQSRNINDFDGRIAARRELQRIAPGSFDELRSIVEDPLEDLDIRRAAIRWLAASDPSDARRIIRRQRRDENPVIADVAELTLEEIKQQRRAN